MKKGNIKVSYVNHMGDDLEIVNDARVSFNRSSDSLEARDEKLIKYLADHEHMTPFEGCELKVQIECPLYIRSQIMRHRTFCVPEDVVVSFSRPDNKRHYPVKMGDLYRRWNDPTQRSKYKQMNLRSLNEKDLSVVIDNKLIDVVESGTKEVIRLHLNNGEYLDCTPDHKVFTPDGWLEAQECLHGRVAYQNGHKGNKKTKLIIEPSYDDEDLPGEEWKLVRDGQYSVSNFGRVRTHINTRRVKLDTPKLKKQTMTSVGYWAVSVNNRTTFVHHLVCEAFLGVKPSGYEIRHLNHNSTDNRLDNLKYGTSQENSNDIVEDNSQNSLGVDWVVVDQIESLGQKIVYDLSAKAPHHSFFANNVAVHNSYNEVSRRYTSENIEIYIPDLLNEQDKKAKQCSAGIHPRTGNYKALYEDAVQYSLDIYEQMINDNVSREQARAVLPQCTMTKFRMKGNLRNWMHFLKLRLDSHAQAEVQLVAQQVRDIIARYFPVGMKALLEEE